jgi:hypothetical protein
MVFFLGFALFLPPKVGGLFLFLKGAAHRRCALRIRASHLGELALKDGWH